MPLQRFDPTGFVDVCFHCGQRNSHFFDLGSVKGKDEPYHLLPGMTLTLRIDDEAGGPGHVEVVTFAEGDFSDFAAIRCDEMVQKLNRSLANATALNDFGGFLILSKTKGEQSSVEAIDGDARAPLGLPMFGANGFHVGCSRPTLGFSNLPDPRYPNHPTHARERPAPQMIQLRRCACGAIAHYVVRNVSIAEMHHFRDDYQTAHRRAVNSLAKHMHGAGHVDEACVGFYQGQDYFATGDYHPDHADKGAVDLGSHEALVSYLRVNGRHRPHELAASAINYFKSKREKSS